MKKRFLSALLTLALCMGLLPMAAFAEPVKLSSIDVTIELPKGGDPFDLNYIPAIKSLKSGDIDLLATGAYIKYTYWNGEFDYDENSVPIFRNGEYLVGPGTISATVNGMAATVSRNKPIYFPEVQLNLKLEGDALSSEQKALRAADWEKLRQTRLAMYTPRTHAEAETYNPDNMPEKVIVVNTDGTDFNYDFNNMTTLVMDVNNAELITDYVCNRPYLKEIWLSPETSAHKFVAAMGASQRNIVKEMYYYEYLGDIPLYTAEATVFIPEAQVSEFKEKYGATTTFSIRSYSGNDVVAAQKAGASATKEICTNHSGNDVVAAQKAGASATKEICTNHKFTAQIASADRLYTADDGCRHTRQFYYSCAYCGKCEYNPNHVDYNHALPAELLSVIKLVASAAMHGGYESGHSPYGIELPNDSSYIGVNAAGQHVWWTSCAICGKDYSYEYLNPSTYDQQAEGATNRSFEEYKAQKKATVKQFEEQALASVELYPNTFTLPLKSDARMSEWAQSDVNLALNDNLLDTDMLGNDYTWNINRQQFCSVAVRLAETLLGKELTPAANIFADTDNPYVLKAYAAGITTGTSDATFSPYDTLTRQQMATFIYRTLRYVEQNSSYKYTSYTSKLDSYTDSNQVQSWAQEAMAFMNALDLVKGTTDTTLNPDGLCTIEQALTVAERSVYAHQLGWYQVEPHKTHTKSDAKSYAGADYAEFDYNLTIHRGDYVWVTGRRYGNYNYFSEEKQNLPYVYVPIINPFNGQAAEMKHGDLVPVRD